MYILSGKLLVLSALARAMSKNGYKIHVSHVSRVFKGERTATKDFIVALAKVLGTTETEASRLLERARAANQDFHKMKKMIVEET